jgi:hypothetical protein
MYATTNSSHCRSPFMTHGSVRSRQTHVRWEPYHSGHACMHACPKWIAGPQALGSRSEFVASW